MDRVEAEKRLQDVQCTSCGVGVYLTMYPYGKEYSEVNFGCCNCGSHAKVTQLSTGELLVEN